MPDIPRKPENVPFALNEVPANERQGTPLFPQCWLRQRAVGVGDPRWRPVSSTRTDRDTVITNKGVFIVLPFFFFPVLSKGLQ